MKNPLRERAQRTTARRVAAALIAGMAETDIGLVEAAPKLNMPEDKLWQTVMSLIGGFGDTVDLRQIADIAFACGFVLQPTLQPYQMPLPPVPQQPQQEERVVQPSAREDMPSGLDHSG